jgi:hypothetical protein
MDEETKKQIERLEKIMATTQAQLDAVIAALPAQIETSVENAIAPIITAIQNSTSGTTIDLTNEVNALQAMPAAIGSAVAASINPPTASSSSSTSPVN